jgi:2-isopropylmalate synthase
MSSSSAVLDRLQTGGGIADDLLVKLILSGDIRRLSADARRELLEAVREKEIEGYDLVHADGTLELLVREAAQPGSRFFKVLDFEVTTRMRAALGFETKAQVTVEAEGAILTAHASGHGPVNALDVALRECLATMYQSIGKVRLIDYQVRMLEPDASTAARVRVTIDWCDGDQNWTTAGVSEDIIQASWLALIDAIRLELMRLSETNPKLAAAADDNSWAV